MDKVQTNNFKYFNAPSSETFGLRLRKILQSFITSISKLNYHYLYTEDVPGQSAEENVWTLQRRRNSYDEVTA
jgi:hypothetical protein